MTIALCIISKHEEKERKLAYDLASRMSPFVDKVYITLNGKEDSMTLPDSTDKVEFSYFKWIDDFSACRNFNFSQAKEDWIFWLDTDDDVKNPENIRTVLGEAERFRVSGVFLKYLYDKDEHGRLVAWHWKARLLKNDGHFTWGGRIHEDVLQRRRVNWVKEERVQIDHNTSDERREDSIKRNIAILVDEIKKQGDDSEPRLMFYLGTAWMQLEHWQDAINLFEKYIEKSGWDEERYEAMQRMSECYMHLKDTDGAKGILLKSLEERPEYPDAYFGMAKIYQMAEDWKKSIEWSETGLRKPRPDNNLIDFPMKRELTPLAVYAYSLMYAGRLDESFRVASHLAEKYPQEDYIKDLRELVAKLLGNKNLLKFYAKIVAYLKDTNEEYKIPSLLQSVPMGIRDNVMITKMTSDYMPPKKWGNDSIVFLCGLTAEPWSPKSLDRGGIGGSETAIIHLARELAKKGRRVTVYNWCDDEEGEYDGVIYKNYWSMRTNDKFNDIVIWRVVDYVDYNLDAKNIYIDLHDVPTPPDYTKERLNKITKIFVKSKYHRELLHNVPDYKIAIVPNGIDIKRYEKDYEKIQGSAIYSSTPNRGLDILLDLWPKIKEQVPQASLRIFYGWKTYYELQKNNPPAIKWMKKIQEQMESLKDKDVIDMGRVGQQELAKWQSKSVAWLYPTYFPEISPLHGDTEIETLSGKEKIKNLVGTKGFHVYSCDVDGKLSVSVVNGVFKTRENAPMIKLTLKPGMGRGANKEKILILTPDHEVMLRDGTYRQAGKLLVGDRVKAFHRQKNAWGNGYDMIGVTGQEIKPEHRFVEEWKAGKSLDDDTDVDHLDGNTRNNEPDNLEGKTRSQHWKDTWSRKSPSNRKTWADSRTAVLKKFHESMTKEELLKVKSMAARKRWGLKNHTITKIEVANNSDAYCMEVEPDHNFVANGIFVHNCITAMEAQAAGAVPVCIDYAALEETVRHGVKIHGDIYDEKVKEEWLQKAIETLKSPPETVEMKKWAKDTYSWESVADKWFKEMAGWDEESDRVVKGWLK